MLEHITAVSPDLPSPSSDWEPCKRIRNGKVCGERLDFSTNGMGMLVAQCPVCDWGWRPSRDYDAFRNRLGVIPQEHVHAVASTGFAMRACVTCDTFFAPRNSAQKFCNDACRPNTATERNRLQRANWRAAGLCGLCGREREEGAFSTCANCRARRLSNYHNQRARETSPRTDWAELSRIRRAEGREEYARNRQLRGAAYDSEGFVAVGGSTRHLARPEKTEAA